MAFVDHEGLRVDLIDEGVGPPVILAHSSVAGNRQWKRLVESLRDRYRVLAPNLHGYGQTTPWTVDGTLTIEAAADVLLAVCNDIDEPIRLVGHSWGGGVALAAARKLGARVSHLVLFEPMLPSLLLAHGRAEAWREAAALHADVKRLGKAERWSELAERFTTYFNGDGAWAATPRERQEAIAALLLPNYFEWDAALVPVKASYFSGVSARTLLMRSADTRLVLYETADVLAKAFPHWQFIEVAEGGHMAPLTRSSVVNPVVAGFLDSQS